MAGLENQALVFLLDKPKGLTSFQCINKLKKSLGLKKVGHCGTLDRFAEGLLIVLSNQATKIAQLLTSQDKAYHATLEFGKETETLDPEGKIIAEAELPSLENIEHCLQAMLASGPQMQQEAPAFSAIHVGGKRLYQKALAGEDLSGQIPVRSVRLDSCVMESCDLPLAEFKLSCSKGFYVRSFARDLGRAAGSCAYLRALHRTQIGPISLRKAQGLDFFAQNRSTLEEALVRGQLSSVGACRPEEFACYPLGDFIRQYHSALSFSIWDEENLNMQLLRKGILPNSLQERARGLEQSQPRIALFQNAELLALLSYDAGETPSLRFQYNFSTH